LTTYVIDASVAVKWWVSEEHSATARSLIGKATARQAPDLLMLELGNVLLKKLRLGDVSRTDAAMVLAEAPLLTVLRPSTVLAPRAFELAVEFRQTMYDATYVVLALAEHCPLVTADRRLYNALSPHFKDTMLWIADLPDAP